MRADMAPDLASIHGSRDRDSIARTDSAIPAWDTPGSATRDSDTASWVDQGMGLGVLASAGMAIQAYPGAVSDSGTATRGSSAIAVRVVPDRPEEQLPQADPVHWVHLRAQMLVSMAAEVVERQLRIPVVAAPPIDSQRGAMRRIARAETPDRVRGFLRCR